MVRCYARDWRCLRASESCHDGSCTRPRYVSEVVRGFVWRRVRRAEISGGRASKRGPLIPPTRSRLRSSSPSLPFYHPPVSPGLVPAVVHIPSLESSTSSAYSQWLLRRFPGKKVSTGPTSRLVSARVPSASGCDNQIAEPVVRTRCHYEHGNA